MCAVTHTPKPYQLAHLIKKSLDDIIGTQQSACDATLQYQFLKIFISPLSMLYLHKVLLIHLKKCVFYIIHKESSLFSKLTTLTYLENIHV